MIVVTLLLPSSAESGPATAAAEEVVTPLQPVNSAPVVSEPVSESVISTEPATPAVSLQSQIDAHLAVGEFAPALKLAEQADSPAEKTKLMTQVAMTQAKMGERKAALNSVSRIPVPE